MKMTEVPLGKIPEVPPGAVLTIAGSDPSGGAGIQADLKVFSYLGLYGLSVITALTAQNTMGVQAAYAVPPEQVATQMESLTSDFRVAVTKTGMLPNVEIIEEVHERARAGHLGLLVIDPVLSSTGGFKLAQDGCAERMISLLVPECRLITPNLTEAARLSGRSIDSAADAMDAARALVDAGAGAACVTGGHWPGSPVDYLFDGKQMFTLEGIRIGGGEAVHGTGCLFSAATAGFFALDEDLLNAVQNAKRLVERAIADAVSPGAGMKVPSLKLRHH